MASRERVDGFGMGGSIERARAQHHSSRCPAVRREAFDDRLEIPIAADDLHAADAVPEIGFARRDEAERTKPHLPGLNGAQDRIGLLRAPEDERGLGGR